VNGVDLKKIEMETIKMYILSCDMRFGFKGKRYRKV
jgi:hypothetical protein